MALGIENLGQAMTTIDQLNRALVNNRAEITALRTQLSAAQKLAEDRGAEVERLRAALRAAGRAIAPFATSAP